MSLYHRSPFHSFSTIQEHAPQGWDWCMSKAYCKWPVIVGIIIAVVFTIFTLYCCLRCCGCCGLGRRRRDRGTAPSMFNPVAAYHGYQPAHNPAAGGAPPPYQNFAQFDAPSKHHRGVSSVGGAKLHEDSLPSMPVWESATSKRVEDKKTGYTGSGADDVEMGYLKQPMMAHANPSSTNLSANPPEHIQPYTGPDFGVGSGNVDTSYHGAAPAASPAMKPVVPAGYTGPDFFSPKPYAAYTPLTEETAAGPHRHNLQETDTTYGHTQAPTSYAPNVLQAGPRV